MEESEVKEREGTVRRKREENVKEEKRNEDKEGRIKEEKGKKDGRTDEFGISANKALVNPSSFSFWN